MSDYIDEILNASGGHAAPAETLDESKIEPGELATENPCWEGYVQVGMKEKNGKMVPNCVPADEAANYIVEENQKASKEALTAAGYMVPEEQEFAKALLEITKKYGKFNADDSGVWAGYTPAKENDNKDFGVKCGNCIFWNAPNGCKIVEATTEEGGLCRLAVIPDGIVSKEKEEKGEKPVEEIFSKKPKLEQYELKEKIKEMGDNYEESYLEIADLIPTQEVVKTENFKSAKKYNKPVIVYIDSEGKKLVDGHHRCATRIMSGMEGIEARIYRGPVVAAASENCPPATQDIQLNLENRQKAIENVGYGPLNPAEPNEEFWQDKADRWDTSIDEAKSAVCGNCIFFVRTTEMLDCLEEGIGLNEEAEGTIAAGELGYCNALDFKCASERTCNAWAAGGPVTDETVTATAGSKPAEPSERIKGSKKNKPGSAAGGKKIKFSKKVTKALENKVKEHNEKHGDAKSKKTNLRTLKAVYRRGAGAFSTSHRPDQNRNSWSMARVNAFLYLLRNGRPKNSKYTQDNDLLPAAHKRSTKKSNAIAASAYIEEQLEVRLLPREEYASDEHAIFSITEFSGLGYEALPSFRAAWLRGLASNEDPFNRAALLAAALYDSPDADLLPKESEDE